MFRRNNIRLSECSYGEDSVRFVSSAVQFALRLARLVEPKFAVDLGTLETEGPRWTLESSSIGGYQDYSIFVQRTRIAGELPPWELELVCSTSTGYDPSESELQVWVRGLDPQGSYIALHCQHDTGMGPISWKGLDIEQALDEVIAERMKREQQHS